MSRSAVAIGSVLLAAVVVAAGADNPQAPPPRERIP